jgi:hypothetical protein
LIRLVSRNLGISSPLGHELSTEHLGLQMRHHRGRHRHRAVTHNVKIARLEAFVADA